MREPVPIAKDEPLKLELQSFVNCVREKQTPVVSGESAKRALDLAFEITRQIQQSNKPKRQDCSDRRLRGDDSGFAISRRQNYVSETKREASLVTKR